MKHILLAFLFTGLASLSSFASEDHDHEKDHQHTEQESEKHDDHDEPTKEDHPHDEEEKDHDHKEEAHEEKSSAVGADKGILEKNSEGFKLAPEAIASFGLEMRTLGSSVFEIPHEALVIVKMEKAIYRVRNGWIRRVPVKVIKKQNKQITIEVSNWQSGDQLIIKGVGFVRTSELVAEEGMAAGHSH